MSSKYEGRDEACPVSTGGKGGGGYPRARQLAEQLRPGARVSRPGAARRAGTTRAGWMERAGAEGAGRVKRTEPNGPRWVALHLYTAMVPQSNSSSPAASVPPSCHAPVGTSRLARRPAARTEAAVAAALGVVGERDLRPICTGRGKDVRPICTGRGGGGGWDLLQEEEQLGEDLELKVPCRPARGARGHRAGLLRDRKQSTDARESQRTLGKSQWTLGRSNADVKTDHRAKSAWVSDARERCVARPGAGRGAGLLLVLLDPQRSGFRRKTVTQALRLVPVRAHLPRRALFTLNLDIRARRGPAPSMTQTRD
jgi:hypothetical protein